MFHIISYVSNIFQTVYPQVAHPWMSHFDSQLLGCYEGTIGSKIPSPGVDVLAEEGRQELPLGAVVPGG